MKNMRIGDRKVGAGHPPFVIAEAGINHEGSFDKALKLVDAAVIAKADCIKFQSHIAEAEMIKSKAKPGKLSSESVWDIIKRCELSEDEEKRIKKYCEKNNIMYLSTPFSREAADRLSRMDVPAFKIGSGECNNLPLIEHIAKKGKPMILSTGMNDIGSIGKTLKVIRKYKTPVMLMHCTSIYPTPYEKVRLGAIGQLMDIFGLPVGLSDHSQGIYTCLGAVSFGACVLEKHFTVSRKWPGPDISISIEPGELSELVKGAKAVWQAMGGKKEILSEEMPVINFAYASVVAIRDIKKNEKFTPDNIWVKRPGTGEIKAVSFKSLLGKKAKDNIAMDSQLKWRDTNG
ncbi:MAG: N-acetylneuraminate synthase family protein [Candidatus Omnitrophica bacterium]|nr:N-acetylneuraminate synthase family protein [Candidatus Omnitrophota bacterium]